MHSRHSDGTATVPEIAAAARAAGAEAVLVTDHDTLAARGEEGWYGGAPPAVLVLAGHEVSPRGGHLLAFGTPGEIGHVGRSEAEICAAVAAAGGLSFAAHPFSRGSRISTRIAPPHGWAALDACDGIELWSLVTDSAEACAGILDLVRLVREPERRLDGPPPDHLAAWDALCAHRRVPAIGGLDAHQTGLRIGGRALSPMPNARWFRMLQTSLQLDRPPAGDLDADRAAVLDALREGRCVLVRRDLGDARGFRFWAEGPDGALTMGAEAPAGRWTLYAHLPRAARLRLRRDGAPVAEATADRLRHDATGAGVFRIEARLPAHGGERTWIVSNPIYLRR